MNRMKKILALLGIGMMLGSAARADEGMWTLCDLPQAVYQQMQGYGYQMPCEQLYQGDSAIAKAVVNFSDYCSGVVVSPDGLVFTNHHCGFEAIRSHSTVEHDYMLNGFYAKTQEEELPNEDMFVSFMVEQRDITDDLLSQGLDTMTMQRRTAFLDSVEIALSLQVKAQDSTLRAELKPFYEGNRYYLTTYRDFTDLRLVFALPKSMGKFGGETDNWMWPRQTCDFSVFRIYADPKTNGPAGYSKDNVPYRPKVWACVARDGYREGDFAMTMGYPGSTSRYLSSYGIEERYEINRVLAQVRGIKQEVMKRHMNASEAVRIKYDSKYAQSSNYWKNSIGMNKCIDSIGLVSQKRQYEAVMRHWQDSTRYLADRFSFDTLQALYARRYAVASALTLWGETFRRNDELSVRAYEAHFGASPKGHGRRQYITFSDNQDAWDYDTDREVLGVLLQNYRQQLDSDSPYLPEFYKNVIDPQFGGDCQAYADYLYSQSRLLQKGKKLYPNRKSFMKDPGVSYGLDLVTVMNDLRMALKSVTDSIDVQERYLCALKLRMEEDMPHYSDANFTMRMSLGQVKEYQIGGYSSGYFTDAQSMVRKMKNGDSIEDYRVEPEMLDLMNGASDLHLCFLTTNDITGGNSGSPVFDARNRLLGLAFDGNWDSLASDIYYDSQLARCISVDIRYVLYMMEHWGHADRLLQSLTVE